MSKLKTPREKKLTSLARDRRTAKTSRKVVPAKKAKIQRKDRHAVAQALHIAAGPVEEELALAIDEAAGSKRRKEFKKQPDVPLGEHLEQKKGKRLAAFARNQAKAARAKAKPAKAKPKS